MQVVVLLLDRGEAQANGVGEVVGQRDGANVALQLVAAVLACGWVARSREGSFAHEAVLRV